jgi:flagellar biosynthesis/type III secretory pathway chaperone
MAMVSELVDTIQSLIAIMREETEALETRGRAPTLTELAAAKARLVGILEAKSAEFTRAHPDWVETLEPEAKDALLAALAELKEVSEPNARVLSRHIELSLEMMAAVAAEAKRLSGTRHATYGAGGSVQRKELATPISINSRY